MSTFRSNKFVYEEILEMEDLYNNTPMEDIKENLFQIRQEKRQQYVKHCKNIKVKAGKFRMFEGIFSEHTEHSYFNKSHPSNISFLTLIKICNHLNLSFEKVIETPQDRHSSRTSFTPVRWTESLISEFIHDYEQPIGLEVMAEKYDLAATTILRFYPFFKDGKDCNGKIRTGNKED